MVQVAITAASRARTCAAGTITHSHALTAAVSLLQPPQTVSPADIPSAPTTSRNDASGAGCSSRWRLCRAGAGAAAAAAAITTDAPSFRGENACSISTRKKRPASWVSAQQLFICLEKCRAGYRERERARCKVWKRFQERGEECDGRTNRSVLQLARQTVHRVRGTVRPTQPKECTPSTVAEAGASH